MLAALVLQADFFDVLAQGSDHARRTSQHSIIANPEVSDRVLARVEDVLAMPVTSASVADTLLPENKNIFVEAALGKARHLYWQRQYEDATHAVDEALMLARESGDRRLEMQALGLVGRISREVFLASSLKAVPYHEAALVVARELSDTVYMIRQLMALADNYSQAGRNDEFLENIAQAAHLLQNYDIPVQRIRLGEMFGAFLGEQRDSANACKILYLTRSLALKTGDRRKIENIYRNLFWMYLSFQDIGNAASVLDSVRAVNPDLDDIDLAEPLYHLEKLRGNRDKAFYHLEKAYRMLEDDYSRRGAEQLAAWETRLRTRETELKLEAAKRTRLLLIWLTVFISALLAVSIFAWYAQRRAKRNISAQNVLIRKQTEDLLLLDRLKSRFFVNVSHELRTPLSLILGPLEAALKNGGLDRQNTQMLTMAHRNGRQLLNFVEELLLLETLNSAPRTVEEQPVVLYDFITDVTGNFEQQATLKKITLRLDFRLDQDIVVLLDGPKMLKILYNLLANALKFTDPGGNVAVQVYEQASRLCINVQDNGKGISPEDLPHIFELYYQSRQINARAEGGAGIGLSLSLELAKLLGGTLTAESRPGEGSVFTVELPLRICPPGTAGMAEKAGQTFMMVESAGNSVEKEQYPEEGTADILIVEDHADMQNFLRTGLAPYYRVAVAGNGQEACSRLENAGKLPDLILSDLMMPVMDGYQLLETIRKHPVWRTIPVIVLTARTGRDDRLRAFHIGVDDYLLKPFGLEELLVHVENALRNHAARMEWTLLKEQQSGNIPSNATKTALPEVPGDYWLEQVTRLIRNDFGNSQFNIDHLAEMLGMKRTAFYQRIRQESGMSANQFIQEVRLLNARELLETKQARSVREAAKAVGFRSTDYFSRLFRQRFGKSPAEYI